MLLFLFNSSACCTLRDTGAWNVPLDDLFSVSTARFPLLLAIACPNAGVRTYWFLCEDHKGEETACIECSVNYFLLHRAALPFSWAGKGLSSLFQKSKVLSNKREAERLSEWMRGLGSLQLMDCVQYFLSPSCRQQQKRLRIAKGSCFLSASLKVMLVSNSLWRVWCCPKSACQAFQSPSA